MKIDRCSECGEKIEDTETYNGLCESCYEAWEDEWKAH